MDEARRKSILMDGARRVLGSCTRCDLCRSRRNIIWGGGNVNAPIMLVAGNVTYAEDNSDMVLAGDAGHLVARAMYEVGLDISQDVYVAPAIKCQRPYTFVDGERTRADTTDEQVDKCKRFILWQLQIVRPAIVVAHGKLAARILLGEDRPHVAYNGTWRLLGKNTLALATHNPAGLVFGERVSLQGEYLLHWRGLAERLSLLGRIWRPEATCFQRGWTYERRDEHEDRRDDSGAATA